MDIKNKLIEKKASETISKVLFPDFKKICDNFGNEYVFFSDCDVYNGFENKVFVDKTSFEAFSNHLHIIRNVDDADMKKISISATFLCNNYLQLLKNQFPEKSFTVYITAEKHGDLIIRFHQNWQGEEPYYNDSTFGDDSLIIKAQS